MKICSPVQEFSLRNDTLKNGTSGEAQYGSVLPPGAYTKSNITLLLILFLCWCLIDHNVVGKCKKIRLFLSCIEVYFTDSRPTWFVINSRRLHCSMLRNFSFFSQKYLLESLQYHTKALVICLCWDLQGKFSFSGSCFIWFKFHFNMI